MLDIITCGSNNFRLHCAAAMRRMELLERWAGRCQLMLAGGRMYPQAVMTSAPAEVKPGEPGAWRHYLHVVLVEYS